MAVRNRWCPVCTSSESSCIDKLPCIAQYGDRNWRSAWLILSLQEYSWFIIDRVYWRKQIKPQVIKVPDDSQDQKMIFEIETWIKHND